MIRPFFAQPDFEEIAPVFVMLGLVALVTLFVSLVVSAVVCWLTSSALSRVPAVHRKMEPGLVWLLMIPCFGLIWNFFVFTRVPDSFKSYFDAEGRRDVGDCGRGIGLAYAITCVCCVVPLLNYAAGLAAVVLLILCLVKFHELRQAIAVPMPPPPPPPGRLGSGSPPATPS